MKIYLGIDPDVNKSGLSFLSSFGVWKLKQSELFNVRSTIFETLDEYSASIADLEATIELPKLDSPSFGASGTFRAKRKQFQFSGTPTNIAENKALGIVCKTAMKIGRCAQIGEEIVKILKDIGIKEITRVKPSERIRFDGYPYKEPENERARKRQLEDFRKMFKSGKKFRYPSKLDNRRFLAITGIIDKKRTNDENRDSALLLIQKYLNL